MGTLSAQRKGSESFINRFTVDTNVFRELGEYLVGRSSTALVELVKNAYDADASWIEVFGEDLEDPEAGRIVLVDDGVGMGPQQFLSGFLRIASRVKSEGKRVSVRYARRYTGAKGIGRLAAHKLARELRVSSFPWTGSESTPGVEAVVDWDEIERHETLDDLVDIPRVSLVESDGQHGTRIELRRLRELWTEAEKDRFIREVLSFQPPSAITDPIPSSVLSAPLLFERPLVRERHRRDPGFDVRLGGIFERGDEFWPHLHNVASWLVEIDAKKANVRYGVAPLSQAMTGAPDAVPRIFDLDHPAPKEGPFFQARIFVRVGRHEKHVPERLAQRHGGISVFLEGFRVLPYGEPGNDWLSIDRAATARAPGVLRPLDDAGLAEAERSAREELLIVPQRHYHGAVFLTESDAPGLRMLVNREGFIPDAHFERLQHLVVLGVHLSTRLRAHYREEIREERRRARAIRARARTSSIDQTPSVAAFTEAMTAVRTGFARTQRNLAAGNLAAARASLAKAEKSVEEATTLGVDLISEEALLRVLASVGTQMASVVHEFGALAISARDMARLIARQRRDGAVAARVRRALAPLERAARDLQHALERQAAYLVDVVSADARRRRSRQRLGERFESAKRLIAHIAEQQGVDVENTVPASLRSPPMFPAEMTSVFSNLLTNAVKAAGRGGRIRAAGTRVGDEIIVRIENTGRAVRLDEAERWFEPFESTTAEVDPVLGQGMGLGLTITRRIVEEYRGSLGFVEPSDGFASAVELRFPT